MSAVNFDVATKITPITIQGEQPSFYARTDKQGNTQLRSRLDNNGVPYKDLFITGTGVASYFAAYKIGNLYTCQYKVELRAVNDTLVTHIPTTAPNGSGVITETLSFGQITAVSNPSGTVIPVPTVRFTNTFVTPYFYGLFPVTGAATVSPGYNAATSTMNVTNGNFTVVKYNSVNMYVTGANVTTGNLNNVLVDYIKLTPILQ
jgi:hypothetical protein